MTTELFKRLKELEETTLAKTRQCRIAAVIEAMEPDTATLLASMLDNPKISTRRIHAALQDSNISVDRTRLGYHRDGMCSCYTKGQF